jgi:PKD domain-containing protein
MVSGLIISRRFLSVALGLSVLLLNGACQKVPLLAPTGSTIILTASATALPVNGTADLTAQILEQSNNPPHSGTLITFTTTLGGIEPSEARTDVNGRVIVKFSSGLANGTATITATSGGATTGTAGAVKIAIGTAAVGRVSVNANPATVPNTGGSTVITATVFDINGNALNAAPVSFTTTSGTLSTAIATTGADGVAATTLTTSQTTTVTASVGATAPAPPTTGGTTPAASGQASGSVTVNISAAPILLITPPSPAPSVGLPANFTFVVTPAATNGSAVRDLKVSWGDGLATDLGAVTGSAIASHTYGSTGVFLVTGVVTDAAGNTNSQSTPVTVVPVPRPGIIVTQSPNPGHAMNETTLTVQVTVATGIFVQSLSINFGDGTAASLGGASSAVVPHIYQAVGTYIATVTVVDSSGQTTIGTAVISIAI